MHALLFLTPNPLPLLILFGTRKQRKQKSKNEQKIPYSRGYCWGDTVEGVGIVIDRSGKIGLKVRIQPHWPLQFFNWLQWQKHIYSCGGKIQPDMEEWSQSDTVVKTEATVMKTNMMQDGGTGNIK